MRATVCLGVVGLILPVEQAEVFLKRLAILRFDSVLPLNGLFRLGGQPSRRFLRKGVIEMLCVPLA